MTNLSIFNAVVDDTLKNSKFEITKLNTVIDIVCGYYNGKISFFRKILIAIKFFKEALK